MTFVENIKSKRDYTAIQWCMLASFSTSWVGLVSSRALVSIALIAICLVGVWSFSTNKKKVVPSFVFFMPMLFFGLIAVTFFYSDNKADWLLWTKLKLPFLLLPIFLAFSVKDVATIYKDALFAFVLVCVVSSFFVITSYLIDYKHINQSLYSGGKLPVPFSHIRYSLQLVITFFISLFTFQKSIWKWLLLAYLFVIIHILSARSGLLALYAGILVDMFIYFVKERKWLPLSGGIFTLILIAILSFNYVTPLKNRVAYMRYDWSQWQSGNIDGNSDAMRLASLRVGAELLKENPFIGVGAGDILSMSKEKSKSLYPQIQEEGNRKMPHNQFIWTAVVSGILGLCVFMFAWLYPIWFYRHEANALFWTVQLVFGCSFLVEYTLEEQVGGTLFCSLLVLFFSYFESKKCQPSQPLL